MYIRRIPGTEFPEFVSEFEAGEPEAGTGQTGRDTLRKDIAQN